MEDYNIDANMTLKQYLKNPAGDAGSNPNIKLVRDALDKKYDDLITDDSKVKFFDINIYNIKKKYYIEVQVPSEAYEMYYSAVFEITKDALSLDDCEIKMFSNSPAFMFIHAYVYNSYNMIIDILKSKLSKKALTEAPVERNYTGVFTFEKSIYFAAKYLLSQYNRFEYIKSKSKKRTENELLSNIDSVDDKISEFDRLRRKDAYLKKHDPKYALSKGIEKDLRHVGLNRTTASAKKKSKITGKSKLSGSRNSHKIKPKAKIHGKKI